MKMKDEKLRNLVDAFPPDLRDFIWRDARDLENALGRGIRALNDAIAWNQRINEQLARQVGHRDEVDRYCQTIEPHIRTAFNNLQSARVMALRLMRASSPNEMNGKEDPRDAQV